MKVGIDALERMGIPKNHWEVSWDAIPRELPHKRTILNYAITISASIQEGTGFYLHGEYGVGKSALAALLLRTAASCGHIGYWVRARSLPEYIIKDVMFDEEMTVSLRCLTVPLLVIDEFQLVGASGFTEYTTEELIRMRLDDMKSTIVTSNVDPITLHAKYPAMASACREKLQALKIQGHNFRG